jgi:hypothetical protein
MILDLVPKKKSKNFAIFLSKTKQLPKKSAVLHASMKFLMA